MSDESAMMPPSSISAYPFRNPQHFLQAVLSHPNQFHAILEELWTNTPRLPAPKSQLHQIAAGIPPDQESAVQFPRRLQIVSAQQIQVLLHDEADRQATNDGELQDVDDDMDGYSITRSDTESNMESKRKSKLKTKSKTTLAEEYDDNGSEYEAEDATHDDDGIEDAIEDTEEYCFCRSMSYGDMVGCENDQCPHEWFHLTCVGLKEPPSETAVWYCPDCRTKPGMVMKMK